MSVSQKIETLYKNQMIAIQKMKHGIDRDMAIGSLVADVGNRSIYAISKYFKCSWRKIKTCFILYKNSYKQIKLEFRGRKKITEKYPKLINDIEIIIEQYKNVDSHFKTETLFISITPATIKKELIDRFHYPEDFACYNTIKNLLKEMGYKRKKIVKTKVLEKIAETDKIFENVEYAMESALVTKEEVAVISIDDKATKKIGNISDNGMSWINLKALDHDTHFEYSMKPFGILDLKTNETFVTCTPYSSTAEFKVNCIEEYITYKNQERPLKKVIIFLDNGPENSGRRKLWLKSLVQLSIKYQIIIELVYYPPYHSKYNKIERFWARLQMYWNKIIIDSLDKLLECLNKVTWKEKKCRGNISFTHFQKGIEVTDYDMDKNVNPHVIREEGLEKWSIVITPFAN